MLVDELKDKYNFTPYDYLKLLNLVDHYEIVLSYTIANEWNYVYDSIMGDCLEPCETVLWHSLMCDHLVHGTLPPNEVFNNEFKSFKVTEEGILVNRQNLEDEYQLDNPF